MSQPGSNRAVRWLLIFGFLTLLGLAETAYRSIRYASEGESTGWRTLAMGLLLWYTWAPPGWFIYRVTRRYPIEARNWPSRLALHLGACVFVLFFKITLDYPVIRLFYCSEPDTLTPAVFYPMALKSQLHSYTLVYATLVGVIHALSYHEKYQERELKAAQLETRLAQAQLQLLKAQLHPHFLFNTLHAISALIPRNADAAERTVARLGDLLRLTLEHHGVQEVSLQQELEFIQAYLELEQIRFGPRLGVRIEVEPDVLSARVPYLILQPLVENAIRHGIAPLGRAGCLAIAAARVDERLRLWVEDSGPGLACKPNGESHGIGLANTQARLGQLYGADHRFELGCGDLGGLRVTVEIPFAEVPLVASDGTPEPAERMDDTDTVISIRR